MFPHPPAAPLRSVSETRDVLLAMVERLEADTLHPEAAQALTEQFAHIERIAGAAKVRCAARSAEVGAWKAAGDRSAGHWLARLTGTNPTAATRHLEAWEQLRKHTDLADAWASGELSITQVELITPALADAPHTADELLANARTHSVAELRKHCHEVRARSRADDEGAHHERQRQRRAIRRRTAADGSKVIELSGPVDDIARINAAINAFREQAWKAQRALGINPGPAAIDFDAAVLLARQALDALSRLAPASASEAPVEDAERSDSEQEEPAGEADRWSNSSDRVVGETVRPAGADDHSGAPSGSPASDEKFRRRPPTITVRVDHTALVRGHARLGEVSEISGLGPAPVVVVQDLIDSGARVAIVHTDDLGEVTRVAHLRKPPMSKAAPGQPPPWWLDTTVIIRVHADPTGAGDRGSGDGDAASGALPGDRFTRALDERGVEVAGLVLDSRGPSAHQRTALAWRDPTCRVAGCTAAGYLEVDHHVDWAHTHHTTLGELGRLCAHHHRLRTFSGYVLGTGPGKQPLHPPCPGDSACSDDWAESHPRAA